MKVFETLCWIFSGEAVGLQCVCLSDLMFFVIFAGYVGFSEGLIYNHFLSIWSHTHISLHSDYSFR